MHRAECLDANLPTTKQEHYDPTELALKVAGLVNRFLRNELPDGCTTNGRIHITITRNAENADDN